MHNNRENEYMGSIGEDEKTEVSEEASEIGKKVTPRLKRFLILLCAVLGLFIFLEDRFF